MVIEVRVGGVYGFWFFSVFLSRFYLSLASVGRVDFVVRRFFF